MAGKGMPLKPVRADLSRDELMKASARFEKLLRKFEAFEPEKILSQYDPGITELDSAARIAIEKTYPHDTTQYLQLADLTAIKYQIPIYAGERTPTHQVQEALVRVKADAIVKLRQAIDDINEDIEENSGRPLEKKSEKARIKRSAFVVHGHDGAPRETVARYLEKLNIQAVILHEQAHKGRTLIEKFEENGDVGFAVVLLTPDDVGGPNANDLSPRSRQNVVLELGYFIGKLGRNRVCAMKKGEVEIPSDILGIGYVTYDDNNGWQLSLARELEAAGIEIDWNAVMKADPEIR